MARIRSIKPEVWRSRHVMNLTPMARLLFIGLITQADDDGRGSADPKVLRANIFPGDDDATGPRIREWLTECQAQFLIVLYDGGAKDGELYEIVGWGEHQKISHRSPSKLPAAGNGADRSGTFQNAPEHSGTIQERSGKVAESDPLIGSDRIGSDHPESIFIPLSNIRARARESQPDNFKKLAPKPDKAGLAKRSGRKNAPRDGPGGLVPLAPILEKFLVERTPDWAKAPP